MEDPLTEEIIKAREERKRVYRTYRKRAQELYSYNKNGAEIRIDDHANVQMIADGAFVEATVWVPKDKL